MAQSWNVGEPGGPAGPFYSVVKPDGQIVAMQILTREMADLIASIPVMQAEVELLRAVCAKVHVYLCQVSPILDGLEPGSGCGDTVAALEAAMDKARHSD